VQKISNEALGRPDLDTYRQLAKLPVHLVLDNVRSALNVGSVFRSADAFRIAHIHLCGITAQPPHREISKTALGATESVPWSYHESTTEAVRAIQIKGMKVYVLEQVEGSIPLEQMPVSAPLAIVFGHEMEGVSQEVVDLCDGALEIAQSGTKHSLNVAVCAGIVCWEVHRKWPHLQG
jgi:tRNA G18 (ribose-2'-O)-methylase SpoU